MVVAVEVTDGQQEEALGIAAHGRGATVRTGHGGLLPPLAADRAAEIEEAVALARSEVARAERKRKYPQWRRDIEPEFERLERVVRQVLVEAPADSRVRKLARYELGALERVRKEDPEANVATRDEVPVQLLEMSRDVLEAAEAAEAAAAELDAVMATAPAQAGGLLPPQGVAVVMAEAAAQQGVSCMQLRGQHHGAQWWWRRRS